MPAAVLAEGLLTGHPGRDYHVQHLLSLVDIEPVDEVLGRSAGRLRVTTRRSGADPLPSGIDAVVVACADSRAARDDVVIITSDPDDVQALATHTDHKHRIHVQPT